jgi:hypothetical protein
VGFDSVTGVQKNRKRILLAAAAVVFVSAILVLLFWKDSQTSRVSVGFVRSTDFRKTVVLAVTNKLRFPITFTVYAQSKAPDGHGYFPGTPCVSSNAPGNSTVTFSIPAVSTSEWRPFIFYTDERFLTRVRFRLDAMAYSNGWWRARDILRAENLRGIANGPEMLGDHPALPAK